ncbi:BapA prefix-like domain-containing protein [Acinetobacter johnsonii]|nr:BapA prefix-like domain-containing protein [Acinetobacter johnsonii]
MTKFIVIEKDSLNKATIDTAHISLNEASIIHTKMSRDDVAEFVRDGNNLVLKLKNGEFIVIEGFFITYDNVSSDLVFEEDGCVLYWFDGTSGFKGISGLEVLLPEAGSKLMGLLPWLVGAGVIGGVIAATDDDNDKKESIPNGTNTIVVDKNGSITGKTENIPEGTDVKITIIGKDKDGNLITHDETVKVDKDGNYTLDIPKEFVDGDLKVESEVVDRNGNTIKAEDSLEKTDHDNDPNTPDQGGLDRVDGAITAEIDPKAGTVSGTVTDVPEGEKVIVTIEGVDKDGNPVKEDVETTVVDGKYTVDIPAAIVDGSPVEADAKSTDNNGKPVTHTAILEGKTDHDNDPRTPDQGGLDRVDGSITVDIVESGLITGTTTDVAPNTDVVLTITGKDADGNNVTIIKTVQTDANGNYTAQLETTDVDPVSGKPVVDGSAVHVESNTTDRNGQAVTPATDSLAAQGDNDNDPSTPEDTGLDLVDGSITVEIVETGLITGTTTDVAPGTDVVLTITGKDADGNNVTIIKTVQTDANGNYTAQLETTDVDPVSGKPVVDGSAVHVESNTTDRNGQAVTPATDSIAAQGDNDNDPSTPADTGLDLVDGSITVEIVETGLITGTTTDVAPGTNVVLTITGKDANGNDVTVTKTVTTNASGNYNSTLTPADGIVDGSAVTVVANTTDRNGQAVTPATDSIAAQGDNDNDPSTPADTGLDLVDGSITVEIVETGLITGTTTDVAPGTNVVLTITGKDANGNDVTVTKTVTTNASGNYNSTLTPADGIVDGSAVTVVANTTDRNGQAVTPATDSIAAQGDNDNDPSTPADTGLDLVDGSITVDIVETGLITGTTTDVAPGTNVVLTITGKDANGNDVTVTKTVTTNASGNYNSTLTPADGIVDGSAVTVVANTTDRNGQAVTPATDSIAAQGDNDNDPSTPADTGLDLVDGSITVDIVETGLITGTTTDVAPGTNVVLTITGKDANGNDVTVTKTVTTNASGNYNSTLTPADGIVDGSAVTVVANTTDRNGQAVTPATDSIAAQGDNDNDPSTPADTGLDLVDGSITVEIVETGLITGTTTDVAPGTNVVLTITGKDANGNDVTVTKTVTTNASGNYNSTLTPADGIVDGSAVTVVANTTDRNGQAVTPATDSIAAQGDNDNDPSTPADTGLDLVDGSITVEIVETGLITGTTTDVAPGTNVVLTITGKDANGNDVTVTKTVTTNASGNYNSTLTPADGIVDGSAVTVVANTTDRNGQAVTPATDSIAAQGDNDNDPSTPADTGLDLVDGSITVDIVETGLITGTTTDVAPGTNVVLTITGKDANGNDVTVTKTVTTNASGNYNSTLTPADGIVDGSAVTVVANTTDRNGQAVTPATDSIAAQGDNDNDPSTPADTGLDLVDGSITVDIVETGLITGTTTDVAPGTNVVLTITGKDANGNDVTVTKTVTTNASGNYNSTLTPADGIVDGSAVTVVANTTDRNGQAVTPATDSIAAQGDNDNDPSTPADTGLDLVDGSITVEIVETGLITGTTTDVAPGTNVVLTITGKDANGNDVTVTKTVTTNASGNYNSTLTPADGIVDGSAVTVVANTTDRNGQAVTPATDSIAAQGDNDNDPSTPADTGLDLVDGSITVEIVETGLITGTTTDVAPGTNVVLTITGKDANGNDVTVTKTVTTNASGNYNSTLTPADGIVDGSAVTVVANTTDRNGQAVTPATDSIAAQGDNDNDPSTPADTGLDLVDGSITVEIVETGLITGTTTDVAPGTNVVLTITGKDANGNDVTVTKTVTTNASGNYNSTLTPADGIVDGSAVTVVANTTDRNGQAVTPATDSIAAQGDNDNDPSTPADTGLDLVDGSITVDIVETGLITGTTTDVAPGTNVVLTITGKDANGNDVTVTKTVTTNASGNYNSTLTPADGIVDGSAVTVVANTTDRNGQAVTPATDSIAAQGDNDNDPSTPADTGLDLVDGSITVDIVETGLITGTTTDVAPGTNVVLTITGKDANGNDVTVTKTVTTNASGNYNSTLTPADGIVDGSAVTVVANTTDRNGQAVTPATDSIAAQGDNDNDPSTPADTGLDLVDGSITVDIVETGLITGTTTDVAPGTNVVLTITGKDANGNDVTVTKTVTTNASGNYNSTLTPADGIVDGSAVTVVANTTDRNGQAVTPATDSIAAQGDNDNDPSTPADTGLDLVDGSITVEIVETGLITGTTTDVAPGTNVVLTITGKDANGNDVTVTKTVTTNASGNYNSTLTPADGIVDGSAVTVVANTTDRNGQAVTPATDSIAAQGDNDNDPSTPADTGLDLVDGSITVEIVETGLITGTTTDVAPGTNVVLTITGKDANGNDVTVTKTVTTNASGNYNSTLTPADGIVDGSAVTVVANTTDRNGQAVTPATDSIAAQGDNDNDPSTPADTGLDLVDGSITVEIVETGLITGTTTDVAPGTNVVLTITGKDANGNDVTVTKTVTTNASGNYNSTLTPADGIVDGSAVTVVANTTDRNGQAVTPATDSIAAQGDNDNDPSTPADTGLDLVDGSITVEIVETGLITGTTTDVAPGTNVVLTITGKDANGNDVTVTKTVTTNASGNYNSTLTPADGIVDGSAVTVVANTTDRNGQAVTPATDSIAAQGDNDNDPSTPADTGLDLVDGSITVDIVETGLITGTTTDVAPGTNVVLTITGKDANGNDVTVTKTVTTNASGNYNSTLTPADGIVDGSAVTVVANTTDRNGQAVTPATDSIAAQGDNDNDPSTPADTGLDLVDGSITVDIVETGLITGTTTDVAPGTNVVLTITGKDANGNDVTVTKTVTTNASGNYNSTLTPADGIVDGSAVTVVANTTDRNGQAVTPATDSIAAQGDNDNDPSTPADTGLDLVDGSITVEIVETGLITGTTTDVAPGTNVVLTITGKDANGNDVTVTKTVTTNASGNYNSTLTPADGIVDGSAVTVVANTTDRNGQAVTPATDSIAAQGDNDNDPSTPADTGLDLVDGSITVDIVETGLITGTTTDVAPGTNVVLTITGKDANGNDVTVTKTVTTNASGNYNSTLTPADGIVDGSAVTVVANTTDRNGQAVTPATDSIAAQGDNDNDPSTPADTGLDLVDGSITVEIVETGLITGTTTDVAPGTNVVLTITGKDANGNDVTVTKTVTTNASGNYNSTLTPADGIVDGSAVTVVANTTDRNGQAVTPATDSIAAQGDNDNDPSTPADTGLDLVDGSITVEIVETGLITGTTTDVAPGTNVVLTITGKDADGNNVTIIKTVQTDANGNYTAQLETTDVDPVSGKPVVDGSAVHVESNTTDRNGQAVTPATDSIAAQGDNDNDPSTPADTGLDLVDGSITVDIVETGLITGTTTDVAPGTNVVLTITGKDANGNDVTVTKTVTTNASGNYNSTLTPADGIVDGSAVTVVANTTDRNGQAVTPATDSIAAQGDNDNDPSTPADTGLDLVDGSITVEIVETGLITGTTTDVAPGTNVVLTITGKDANGNDVTVTKTVTTNASGNYNSTLTPADGIVDGSAVTVVANTTDRNGQAVTPATDSIAAQGDNDNDPSTPADTGLDLVDGSITVDIVETGLITGTTTDVAPGTNVVLTITGKDANGNDVTVTKTVTTNASGNYNSTLTPADGIVDGSAVTVVANTTDRNGQAVTPATDSIAAQGDNDNDPSTPADTGLDLVDGSITVDIVETGLITGTTTDVAPGTNVVLTITGKDANGNDVTVTKTVTTNASGNYNSTLTPADGIVDGSAVTVVANTTDRNGQAVTPATDSIAAQGDNDNDPSTPADTGLDLVDGSITVEIVETGLITGTTTDVAPGTNVVLTITGKDANGNDVTVTKTVTTNASGNYNSTLTPADGIVDGSAVTVVANTTDRNGQAVTPATDSIAAQGDNDNDPSTPADTGLDLVDGSITVDIVDTNSTQITGTTEDVAPNSKVTLEIISIDENGETRTFTEEVFTNVDGEYSYTLTPAQGNVTEVVAKVDDRNGNELQDSDRLDAVVKADPSTDINNGDNGVVGTSGNDVLAGDTGGLKTNFVAGHNYNVSIVLDLSGSMAWSMDAPANGGTYAQRNPPAGQSRLEIAKKGLKAFIQQMGDHDGVINLQIASFSAAGQTGNSYNQVYMNVNADNIDDIFTFIGTGKTDGLRTAGGTYPELGFNKAINWFDSNGISTNGFENQTYYITDGEPNSSQTTLDNAFAPLAQHSKVFAVGVSSSIRDATVSRYDNTDVNGNQLSGTWNGNSNHGTAKAIADADKLIAYLIGGSENFVPADVGNDVVKGGAGDDILFGDAMNTDWITGLDSLQYPKYSGYSKLIAHLKANVTGGAEPTQQQIYDFVKDNYQKFVTADATDTETKGGNDIIYGGSGNDIIIAGAGDDRIYGGSGNDTISTGRGDDTIIYDVLNAADAMGGNGTDTWVDYAANDKIEFGADFFEGLLADKSNISEYIKVEDVNGKAVLKVDRDGAADATGGTTHDWADLLIIEGKTASELQDFINNQIIIG